MDFKKIINKIFKDRCTIYSPIFGTVNLNNVRVDDKYIYINQMKHTFDGKSVITFIDDSGYDHTVTTDKIMIFKDDKCNLTDWVRYIGINPGSIYKINEEYYYIYEDIKSKKPKGLGTDGVTHDIIDVLDNSTYDIDLTQDPSIEQLFKRLLWSYCRSLRESWFNAMLKKSIMYDNMTLNFINNNLEIDYISNGENKSIVIRFNDLIDPIYF